MASVPGTPSATTATTTTTTSGAGGWTPTLSSRPSSSSGSTNVSYEKFAPRTPSQVARLNRIAALTGRAAITPATSSSSSTTTKTEQAEEHSIRAAMIPPSSTAFINNIKNTSNKSPHQLLMMAIKLDDTDDNNDHDDGDHNEKDSSRIVRDSLEMALSVSDDLTQQLKHATSLRLALRASINIADDISNRHAQLIRHSGELSAAADRLQEEEAVLSNHAEEIGRPLQHYDAVDRIGVLVGVLFKGKTTVRGLAKVKVDNDDFPSILDQIDKALDYFGRESGGEQALQEEMKRRARDRNSSELLSGSIEYFRRALALQEAALFLIKEAVADRITNTTNQISSTLNLSKNPVQADQLEASLIYTRYHGISSRSNRLLGLVKSRLHRGRAYNELLILCRNTYCNCRESLLRHTVRTHMDQLKQQHGPAGMTRLASVFLIRLCTVETSLYLDFFGDAGNKTEGGQQQEQKKKMGSGNAAPAAATAPDDSTYNDPEFQTYLSSLCSSFHRTIRRSIVTMMDLDTLCEVVSVLREEQGMASAAPTALAAARAISIIIRDAQERLIFCANATLTKEVIRFKATPNDLDYPAKLLKKTPGAEAEADEKAAETMTATTTPNKEEDLEMEKRLQQVYESWFPPIRSVLRILSKIFRVVETRVFEDLALESVQACTRCLREGANFIRQRKGVMHADLFLVKHLLILREQLSPFDIELRSVERQLDFSDAGKAMARFLANQNRRLFSMTTENALLSLLREGVSVQESSVDSKRDLEDALRSACNDFIDNTAKGVAGDLLKMVEDCKHTAADSAARKALLDADSVERLLTKTWENIGAEGSPLETLTSQMKLYLENPATQSILLKPASRKIVRALDDVRKWLDDSKSTNSDNGWTDERKATVREMVDNLEHEVKKAVKVAR